jgi:C4-dicarboxylate-specific signal transduction histidine kinase
MKQDGRAGVLLYEAFATSPTGRRGTAAEYRRAIDFNEVVRRAGWLFSSPLAEEEIRLEVSCQNAPLWVSGDSNRLVHALGCVFMHAGRGMGHGERRGMHTEPSDEMATARLRSPTARSLEPTSGLL